MPDQLIQGHAGMLQIRPLWQESDGVAVICHPHPLMGGTMDNKVVTTLARFFRQQKISVVQFNFRGVGLSTGSHADGMGEIDDFFCVLDWIASQTTARNLYVAGFSFGGYIAAASCDRLLSDNNHQFKLKKLYLLAPAVQNYPMETLTLPEDTFVMVGDQDEVVPPQEIINWANARHFDLAIIPECSHFFHGQLPAIGLQLERRFP
ncbi:MAG: alpha/beta hydrolase [Candidatus Saccharibacteria bacterium]|nr:alpha/beta hydrolase [Moraxellaceae bacterium]